MIATGQVSQSGGYTLAQACLSLLRRLPSLDVIEL